MRQAIAAVDPDGPPENVAYVTTLLGDLLARTGDTDGAAKAYAEALTTRPGPRRRPARPGPPRAPAGDLTQAIERFQHAVDIVPRRKPSSRWARRNRRTATDGRRRHVRPGRRRDPAPQEQRRHHRSGARPLRGRPRRSRRRARVSRARLPGASDHPDGRPPCLGAIPQRRSAGARKYAAVRPSGSARPTRSCTTTPAPSRPPWATPAVRTRSSAGRWPSSLTGLLRDRRRRRPPAPRRARRLSPFIRSTHRPPYKQRTTSERSGHARRRRIRRHHPGGTRGAAPRDHKERHRVQAHASHRHRGLAPPRGDIRERGPGVEPSGGAGDRRRPVGRQHGPVRVRQPGRPVHRDDHRQLHPARGAGRRPELQRVRPQVRYEIHIDNDGDGNDDITYRFRFGTKQKSGQNGVSSFLYNNGVIDSLTDDNLLARQEFSVTKLVDGESKGTWGGFKTVPTNIGPRSTPNYADLAAMGAQSLGKAARSTPARATTRSSSTWARSSTSAGLRPFNDAHLLPLDPATGVDGVAGYNTNTIAIKVPDRPSVRQDGRASRSSASGRAPAGASDQVHREGRHAHLVRPVGPGLAAGQPAHQRGDHPAPPQGLLERPSPPTTSSSRSTTRRPNSRASSTSSTRRLPDVDDDRSHGPLADPAPGRPDRERHAGRALADYPPAEHGHPAVHGRHGDRQRRQVPRDRRLLQRHRCGRRPRGVPQRPPARGRRHRHRDPRRRPGLRPDPQLAVQPAEPVTQQHRGRRASTRTPTCRSSRASRTSGSRTAATSTSTTTSISSPRRPSPMGVGGGADGHPGARPVTRRTGRLPFRDQAARRVPVRVPRPWGEPVDRVPPDP